MNAVRLVLSLWLALCCALAQADVVKVRAFDDIIESGVLKVAMYENFPPYSYQQDGQPRGVDFELSQKLAEGLGLKLEVLWVTPDETLDDDLRNFIWKGHYLRRDVLFAGDILFYQRALTTPNSPGLDVWLADLDTLQGLPWKRLVAGHGPVADDAAPFVQMRDYLGWLDGLLRDSAASGADMNEVIQSPIPERFAGISLTRYELIRSVSHLYPRYEADALERVDQ